MFTSRNENGALPASVRIAASDLSAIGEAARRAVPEECCGLLAGWRETSTVIIDSVHPSPNLADDRRTRFEVDPGLRLRLQRHLRAADRAVVGIFHSHPGGPAEPSRADLDAAWEPDLVWLVTGVPSDGGCPVTSAFALGAAGGAFRFFGIPLEVVADRPSSRNPAA